MRRSLAVLALAVAVPVFGAESLKCPATADTWISSCDKEGDANMGKAARIKLKGYQEFALLNFDVAALKGKQIAAAALCVAPAEGRQFATEARGTDLRWFTVSSINSSWVEGEGTNYTIDYDGKGATFNEASFGKRPWAYPGSKLWDVILGNGESIRCDVDAGDPREGWFTIPIDKRIVEALVAGASQGLLLMDGSLFINGNAFISSRESQKAPYLKVVLAGDDTQAPPTPADLVLEPAADEAGLGYGALKVSLRVPEGAFAYQMKIDGKPAARWQIPLAAKAGARQSFVIEFLEPDKEVKVELAAVDSSGNLSAPASATGRSSGAVSVPRLPLQAWRPVGGEAPRLGKQLKVWAFPEICKLDPRSGEIALESGMDDASARNSIWDAGGPSPSVRIVAARGEIAGFQLALESCGGPVSDIKVAVRGLQGVKVRLFREWFVPVKGAWQADYAIPLSEGQALAIPAADNLITAQKATALAVDLIVAPDAKTGVQIGDIQITAGAERLNLPLKLEIFSAVIPAGTKFIPELNCYSGPLAEAGSEKFFNAFRVAHYYRATLNRVPHGHNGRTDADWIPGADSQGHVTDWTTFDRNLGPLLDGSAFRDNPRAGVPVPVLYLPFNESWPLPFGPHYHPGADVPLTGADWKPRHDLLAKAPQDAFEQSYQDAFVTCVKDFVKHAEEKGWSRTLLQCYNNNKFHYGAKPVLQDGKPVLDKDGKPLRVAAMTGTAWTLDEPQTWLDWQALLFFSKLFHKGIADAQTTKFVYRGDISRPMWQGDCFDGHMEVMVAGGSAFSMLPLMKNHIRRMPTLVVVYGGCNNQDKANHQTTAWVLKSYTAGFEGVLPWQSVGGDEAFDKGDFIGAKGSADNGNMLIVDGSKRFGVDAIASLRLQAMRSGAQLAELLRLLEARKRWSRRHSLALVSQVIALGAEFKQAFADDAAALCFDDLNGDQFVRLKEGILRLLER